jgi:tripeptidyl-peptidase I
MNNLTSFSTVLVNNGTNPQNLSLAGYESDLDIEYTVGLATGIPVTFISVGGFPQPGTDLDIFLYAADYL